jgi:stage 0 sporulation regulatory protein
MYNNLYVHFFTADFQKFKMLVKIMSLSLIEKKRKQLIELALTYGFSAKETIQCSQELDELLNMHLKEMMVFAKEKEDKPCTT